MKPLLSICMIVKNEEKVLRRCLDSVKDIADEIIIVDTGSEDSTKDIAVEYTNLVYEYKWKNDFSKARNFAASKASGEWIMAIDADEYVDSESFTDFKNSLRTDTKYNILSVQIVNFIGYNGMQTSLNYHERIYRNNGLIYYYRNIHEMLKHKNDNEKRGLAKLNIFHSGYMKTVVKEKNKSKRNLSLLINKKKKDPIDYYFIGNEYQGLGELEKAIESYKKGYQLKDGLNYDWVRKLIVRLIICLNASVRNKEALEIINACEEVYSELVDFKFLKGKIYKEQDRVKEAINIFENILGNKETLIADTSPDYLEYLPHRFLGELYEQEEEKLELAVHHYSKTLSINDMDDYIWYRLINLLSKQSTIDELNTFINNNCLNRKTMTYSRIVRILFSIPKKEVQQLTRAYLDESTLSSKEKQAILAKNLLFEGKSDQITEMLRGKTIGQLTEILSTGIFNIVDFILVALDTKENEFISLLYKMKFEKPINNLLNLFFAKGTKVLSKREGELFVEVLEQAKFIGLEEIIAYLESAKSNLTQKQLKKLDKIASMK